MGRIFAQVCLMYHWTLDYCLDSLTMSQVIYFHEQGAIFNNPSLDPKPDKRKLRERFGKNRRIER